MLVLNSKEYPQKKPCLFHFMVGKLTIFTSKSYHTSEKPVPISKSYLSFLNQRQAGKVHSIIHNLSMNSSIPYLSHYLPVFLLSKHSSSLFIHSSLSFMPSFHPSPPLSSSHFSSSPISPIPFLTTVCSSLSTPHSLSTQAPFLLFCLPYAPPDPTCCYCCPPIGVFLVDLVLKSINQSIKTDVTACRTTQVWPALKIPIHRNTQSR